MNFAFLMDPLEKVIVEKDTTFLLMAGAHHKGHHIYFLPEGGTTLDNGHLRFHVQEVIPQFDKKTPFISKNNLALTADQIDVVLIRTDPPFDDVYLMQTWLLEHLPLRIPVINRPSGIRTVNEKLWAMRFTGLVPQTLVSRNRGDLLNFLKEEKDIVGKPTDGFGGQSVFRIKQGDLNAKVILETLSRNFTNEVILQKFIPESEKGDKRILLLNGDPLGAVLRVHAPDDHRNNFFSGGKPYPAQITPRDQEIIQRLKPELQRLGLYLVGIDILGDYLIEVNVTSPTCMQEMNRLYNLKLEEKVISFAENLIDQHKTKTKISQ